ncbi:MAG: hypothetical protein WBG11_08105 [Methylocella sp.]
MRTMEFTLAQVIAVSASSDPSQRRSIAEYLHIDKSLGVLTVPSPTANHGRFIDIHKTC